MPDNLFGEYVVRETKVKVRPSSNPSTDRFWMEKVVWKIICFRDVKTVLYQSSGTTNYYSKSKVAEATADIGKILSVLIGDRVHKRANARFRCSDYDEDVFSENVDLFTDETTLLLTGSPLENMMLENEEIADETRLGADTDIMEED
ncbi:hypothetical protein BDZ91DRAFT_799069 [Kalaharituber pfeilii]|nr:hypothetical protein BDZ91DRAFT_799069 [Kalaharituber pfeilii]